MTDANANRPVDEKSLPGTTRALVQNAKAAGVKNPDKLPLVPKVNPKTRMKEPKQVTRSIRTGNIIETY